MSSSHNPLAYLKKKRREEKEKKNGQLRVDESAQVDTTKQSENHLTREEQGEQMAGQNLGRAAGKVNEQESRIARERLAQAESDKLAEKQEKRLANGPTQLNEQRLAREKVERLEREYRERIAEEVRQSEQRYEAELRGESKGKLEKEIGEPKRGEEPESPTQKLKDRIDEKSKIETAGVVVPSGENAPTDSKARDMDPRSEAELFGKIGGEVGSETEKAKRSRGSAESLGRRTLIERTSKIPSPGIVVPVAENVSTISDKREQGRLSEIGADKLTNEVLRSNKSPKVEEPAKKAEPEKPRPSTDFLSRGIDIVSKAVEADTIADYPKAYDLYRQALQLFMLAMKWEMHSKSKELLRNKVGEYMGRAEILKKFLESESRHNLTTVNRDRLQKAVLEMVVTDRPAVKWEEVVGLDEAKQVLMDQVIFPIKFPHLFTGTRRPPWEGILLYGPPGSGKNHLVMALARQITCTLYHVNSSNLFGGQYSDMEGLVGCLFETAKRERPAIIFLDQIDELGGLSNAASEQIKKEILNHMDDIRSANLDGIFVFGATNRPWSLDSDILGGFQRKIYLGLPDLLARINILQSGSKDINRLMSPSDWKTIGELSEQYSGSDMSDIVQAALYQPLKKAQAAEHFKKVLQDSHEMFTPCAPDDEGALSMKWTDIADGQILEPPLQLTDFKIAMKTSRPSVSTEDSKKYEEWAKGAL